MGLGRLLLPIAVVAVLLPAAPAAGRDVQVSVVDWSFGPKEATISVGDSVTWSFEAAGHTSTSRPGQAESWNSAPTGNNAAGTTFTHKFTRPGRYEYICIPHETFMSGAVEVRPARPALAAVTVTRSGRRARVRFRLGEPAAVTLRVRGPSRRTVRRDRLRAGRHALVVRGLARGAYRAVVTAKDESGAVTRARRAFRIG